MADTHEAIGEINDGSSVVMSGGEEGTSHATFTEGQGEVLEKIYAECSFPDQFQLSKVLLEEPILSDVSMTELRLWFKTRRYHDRLKRENEELAEQNKWLAAGNNLLRRKIERAQLDQLIFDNEFPQNELILMNPIIAEAELNLQPEATDSEGSSTISDDNDSLPSLTEETEDDFLSEAIGTAINCNPIPRPLKLHGPESPLEVYISSDCIGGAVLPFEPMKNYAATAMACAQDFWTMRSSAIFNDGSLLMLANGCLIHSCDGGSTITLLDLFNLEASSVPQLVRSLYSSPEIVAERMTLCVPHYVLQLPAKSDVKMGLICSSQPISLRSFSETLSRCFNDVVNVLMEDGWRWMGTDSPNDVIMSVEQTNRFGANATIGGFICNNVPVSLIRLLKECCSAWMNVNFANQSIAFSEAARHAYPGFDTHNIFEKAVTLNRTELEDEVEDIIFMQITNGIEDTCSVLIFGSIGMYLLSSNTNERQWIQFPSGTHIQQRFASTAWEYVERGPSSVKILSLDTLPSESNSGKTNSAEENPETSI